MVTPNFVRAETTHPNSSEFLQSSQSQSLSSQDNRSLSHEKSWLRLLYYKKTGPRNYKSEVVSSKFFLTADGRRNPQTELNAHVDILTKMSAISSQDIKENIPVNDEHPVCRFPARFFWIQQKLNKVNPVIFKNCKKMNEFMMRLNGHSISLVFSSYFINNPSSAFGHTFLKVNKSDDVQLDLLNYGINYAATVDTKNPMLYVLNGFLGFFRGEFTSVPYYYKVREYNDYESRDIWEYQLNFSPAEIMFFNLHVWELGNAWSWYYFLDRNCSYWAIRVLEAIRPDLDLQIHFKSAFVVPIETVKSVLKTKGLFKDVKFRPSLRSQLLARFQNLNSKQIQQLESIDKTLNDDSNQDKEAELKKPYDAELLQTALLFYDYTNADNYVLNEDKVLAKKQPLLKVLSSIDFKPKTFKDIAPTEAPHLSHPPRKIGFGYKAQNIDNRVSRQAVQLRYKLGFHEILDSHRGFYPHMGLNYLDFSALIFKEDLKSSSSASDLKFQLDFFHLLAIESFMPRNKLESKLSWRVKIGIDNEQFLRDWQEKVGFITYDSGISKAFFKDESLLTYFLLSNTVEANGRFENKVRYGLAPLVGLKLSLSKDTNLIFEAKPLWVYDFATNSKYISQTSLKVQTYLPRQNLSLALDGSYLDSKNLSSFNLGTTLNYYF